MEKPNKTHYAILGMLSIRPMSGYEIKQFMVQSTENFWSESYGQLYPALSKLAKLGLISEKPAKNTDKKKLYCISTKGRSELKKWLLLAPEKQMNRNEFMLKMFFGANTSNKTNIEHLKAEHYQAQMKLLKFQEKKTQLMHAQKDSIHLPYWLMTLQYGIEMSEAKIKWCEQTIKILGAKS